MQYRLITGTDVEKFQNKVNEVLNKGWEPHGSLVTESSTKSRGNSTKTTILLIQPVVKK